MREALGAGLVGDCAKLRIPAALVRSARQRDALASPLRLHSWLMDALDSGGPPPRNESPGHARPADLPRSHGCAPALAADGAQNLTPRSAII
jgi:hypothetical protein